MSVQKSVNGDVRKVMLLIISAAIASTTADYLLVKSYDENSICTSSGPSGSPYTTYADFIGCTQFATDPPSSKSTKVTCSNSSHWTLSFYSDTECSVLYRTQQEVGSVCTPSTRWYPQIGYRESATCVSGDYIVSKSGVVISELYGQDVSCVEYAATIFQVPESTCIYDPRSNEGFLMNCDDDAIRGVWYRMSDCTGSPSRSLSFPYGCNLANKSFPDPWGRGDKKVAACYNATSSAPQSSARVSAAIVGGAIGGTLVALVGIAAAVLCWRRRAKQELAPLLEDERAMKSTKFYSSS